MYIICIYIYLLNLFIVVKFYVFICRFTHVNKDVGKTVSNCIHIRKTFHIICGAHVLVYIYIAKNVVIVHQ